MSYYVEFKCNFKLKIQLATIFFQRGTLRTVEIVRWKTENCPVHSCVCSVYGSAARFVLEEHTPPGEAEQNGSGALEEKKIKKITKRFITFHSLPSLILTVA